jgi:hypothetical protein
MTLLSILLFFVRCLLCFVYCPPYTQILAPPLVTAARRAVPDSAVMLLHRHGHKPTIVLRVVPYPVARRHGSAHRDAVASLAGMASRQRWWFGVDDGNGEGGRCRRNI